MVGLREALAAVLAVVLGVVLIAAPEALVRVHLAGRVPTGRDSPYGEDDSLPTRWRRVIQAGGAVLVLVGVYFGAVAFGAV